MGLNFKLDVGLYRLDQQVACQRIDELILVAKTSNLTAMINKVQEARAKLAPSQAGLAFAA